MGLVIQQNEFQKLVDHAIAGYPHEVVGILAGNRATSAVARVQPLVNERADSPQNRYQVSGLALLQAESALGDEGMEVVGYFHSHPDHSSQYSTFDRDHALPNMSYLIVSIRQRQLSTFQSWRLLDDRSSMQEEPVTFED